MASHHRSTALSLLCVGLLGALSACQNKQAAVGEVVGLTCHGQEWSRCYRQADKACGSGRYQLINQITDAGSNALGNNESLIRANFTQRTLVVRCTDGEEQNKDSGKE